MEEKKRERKNGSARRVKGIILWLTTWSGAGYLIINTPPSWENEIIVNLLIAGGVYGLLRMLGLSRFQANIGAVGLILIGQTGRWGMPIWPAVGVLLVTTGLISLIN